MNKDELFFNNVNLKKIGVDYEEDKIKRKKHERGFKKDNIKKLFAWEGKKELIWIALFIFLGIIIWAYWTETKACKEMINSEEFKEFLFNKAIEKIRIENPMISITGCDYLLNACSFSGVPKEVLGEWGLYNKSNE